MRKNSFFKIPPNWFETVVGLLCSIFVGFLIVLDIDSKYPKIGPREIEFVLMYFICRSLICYELYDTHLAVKFLVIPIRSIPWENVCSAVYIPPRKNKHNLKRGTCVVLSTRPGKHYRVNASRVWLRNPFTTVRIRLDYQDESCLEAIAKHVSFQEVKPD